MDIAIFGLYTILFCAAIICVSAMGMLFYLTIRSVYWLLSGDIEWTIVNIAILLWCSLVMIGVLCVIIGVSLDILYK